jgi:hypothetical protein
MLNAVGNWAMPDKARWNILINSRGLDPTSSYVKTADEIWCPTQTGGSIARISEPHQTHQPRPAWKLKQHRLGTEDSFEKKIREPLSIGRSRVNINRLSCSHIEVSTASLCIFWVGYTRVAQPSLATRSHYLRRVINFIVMLWVLSMAI